MRHIVSFTVVVDRHDNFSNDLILPQWTMGTNSNDKRKNKRIEKENNLCLERAEKYHKRLSIDDNFCNLSENDIRRSPSNCSLSTEFSYKANYQAFKPDELDQYLECDIPSSIVNDNPFHFWSSDFASSKYLSLKRLARKLFSIPATSSWTERLFSCSGIILNKRRQRLSPAHVDNILEIKSALKVRPNLKQTD